MINSAINRIKVALGVDKLSDLKKIKSEITRLNKSYNEDVNQAAHFARLESLYYKEKEILNKLSLEDKKTLQEAKTVLKACNTIHQGTNPKNEIDDETFKKALSVISLAHTQGCIHEERLELIKARVTGLTPVTKTVIKNGKSFNQVFWVARDQADELRGNTITRSGGLDKPKIEDYSEENEKKNPALFNQQKEDDYITNVGDKVNVNYIGRSSGEAFSFKDLPVVGITENSISVKMKEDFSSEKKYADGGTIIFRKDAILEIPKHNSKKWGEDNNYQLQLDETERQERLNNINSLGNLKDYARRAKDKGYSIFEEAIDANDRYIKSKYAPFFAKYGSAFNPIKMFDDCKEHILNHFGPDTKIRAGFTTNGFSINASKNGKTVMITDRTFVNHHPMVSSEKTKGVYNAYFRIYNKKYWGGGLAKKLFCVYNEQYEKMGIEFLSVSAGLASGPYVWPSFGFYGTIEKARQVLDHFKEGKTREIYPWYPEKHDDNIEKAYKEGNKIYIKYLDSEHPVDVTNQTVNLKGKQVKKYAVDSDGDVYEPAKSTTHTITKEEEQYANEIFNTFVRENPNAKYFKNTLFTADAKLKQASKVAFLNAGGAGYFVDLTNKAHKEDFEERIGYNQSKK